MEKSSPPKKLEYTTLEKTSTASTTHYNFYAVVIDATNGYNKQQTTLCSLWVIDPSVHYPPEKESPMSTPAKAHNYCNVTIFA